MCQKPKKKREDMQENTGLLLLCQEIYVGIQNEGSGNENEKSGGREGGRGEMLRCVIGEIARECSRRDDAT